VRKIRQLYSSTVSGRALNLFAAIALIAWMMMAICGGLIQTLSIEGLSKPLPAADWITNASPLTLWILCLLPSTIVVATLHAPIFRRKPLLAKVCIVLLIGAGIWFVVLKIFVWGYADLIPFSFLNKK
jgi:hypothetical protein